ncbi:E3 ubiquitin-protein ligase RMA2 [Acorus gramineus]|uniref:E3 ubiquitin-protein ligase RMA n=1 Tax=Acorus gramineus TaxID=55184 RepID=A0AAV9B811_ACOGR|nr:E3 ubiquitin-protein ligase RMA2 [Acorus gramineus]
MTGDGSSEWFRSMDLNLYLGLPRIPCPLRPSDLGSDLSLNSIVGGGDAINHPPPSVLSLPPLPPPLPPTVDSSPDDGIHSPPPDAAASAGSAADFECNICMDVSREPVVTSCGHLFCWPCLYQWLHVHSDHKECPVCKGEVTESNLTPIFGRGSSAADVGVDQASASSTVGLIQGDGTGYDASAGPNSGDTLRATRRTRRSGDASSSRMELDELVLHGRRKRRPS